MYLCQNALGDIGDRGKFYWAGKLAAEYMVPADDDIIYPPNYVERMVSFMNGFEPPVVVGLHGIVLLSHKMKLASGRSMGYYASREVHMGVGVREKRPGTGANLLELVRSNGSSPRSHRSLSQMLRR